MKTSIPRALTGCALMLFAANCMPASTTKEPVQREKVTPFTVTNGCEGMSIIPGGSYKRGGEQTVVNDFCLDGTEVTAEAYESCVRAGKCSKPARGPTGIWVDKGETCNAVARGREKHPMNCVDRAQAAAYCEARGARLPTDAEWEWAARAGDKGAKYPWGDEKKGNGLGCVGQKTTCAVGGFPDGDNPWGVHDLLGNVAEWTSSNARGSRAIAKGVAYDAPSQGDWETRQTSEEDPTSRHFDLGFRCAKEAPPTEPSTSVAFFVAPKTLSRVKRSSQCAAPPDSIAAALAARLGAVGVRTVGDEASAHDYTVRLTLDVEGGRREDFEIAEVLAGGIPVATFKTEVIIEGNKCDGFEAKAATVLADALKRWIPKAASASATAEQSRARLEAEEKARAAAAAAESAFALYEKKSSAAGWAEFMADHGDTPRGADAKSRFVSALASERRLSVNVSGSGSVECSGEGSGLKQSTLIANLRTVGERWKYVCPKSASISYTFKNPTKSPLFVEGVAVDKTFSFIVQPGATASGTTTSPNGCSGRNVTSQPQFSPGTISFVCRPDGGLVTAAPIGAELKQHPKIWAETAPAALLAFLQDFPRSALTPSVVGRLLEQQAKVTEERTSRVKLTVTPGPAPAKLVDPRPYEIAVKSTNTSPVFVTIEHDGGELEELEVAAGATVKKSLSSKAGEEPKARLVAVRPQKSLSSALAGTFVRNDKGPRSWLQVFSISDSTWAVRTSNDSGPVLMKLECSGEKCAARPVAPASAGEPVEGTVSLTKEGQLTFAGFTRQ